ncbi:TonB-dependent receptor [Flavobacterium sp. Sd200]|uniref:TonB-dependent receptor n=1 Tax=Flavobacterium sp. Sd200 TaxID=2692211 RepID=UPI0013697543|nr:TonB-dependent receptor [Flavobacterium sp. Sd200]MXN92150.1 TonB-dependent receptor [Flavobacterium sp. Sd200]
MKLKFLLITLFITAIGFAQNNGTVTGTVTDKDMNNEPLPFASVVVKGSPISTNTDETGYYTLSVPAGQQTLVFGFLGYESKEVSVTVKANETITVNEILASTSVQLTDVVIEKQVSREKETALLLQQKNAIEMKQNIGAQELSRKGIGDVATAVAKTSGISKQEGSNNVYVRGLGDRYNSTSINGLPVPSNDPEKKNIFLDIFTTDIVDYISIDKVYNTKLFGDFAGGNVDIISKEYRGNGMFEVSVGSKINTNALDKSSEFYLQDGPKKSGFFKSDYPANALTSFNYPNSLNAQKESMTPINFGFKAGQVYNIGEEGKLSLFATANFSNGYEYRKGLNQTMNAQGGVLNSFQQERFSYNTNTTGMFNAAYRLNPNHKLSYNFLIVNSSDQYRDGYSGIIRDLAEDGTGFIQRGTYVQNTLMINQLLGNHKLNEKTALDWGVSYNTVKGDMPDRRQNTFADTGADGTLNLAQVTATDNHRYYQNLKEDELAANIAVSRQIGATGEDGKSRGKISAGYNGRFKKRDFEAIQFNFFLNSAIRFDITADPNRLDEIFNPTSYANGDFSVNTYSGSMRPQTYNGDLDIHAGFGTFDYKFTDKLTTSIGLRYEKIDQSIDYRTQFETGQSDFNRNEFLPNLILKYELNDKHNLRFAASKTYTLPQFKETANFLYEEINEVKIGNKDLYPSQNYNADIKWEFFPQRDELISVTAFSKYILDPINEIVISSATNDISWVNIGDSGYVVGAELEVRKNLYVIDGEFENKLTGGLNLAYMKTHQDLDPEKVARETDNSMSINPTDKTSSFTGASDLLLNADVSYTKNWTADKGITATLMYSHYSDRLYAIGTLGKGNLVDKGMGALDLVLKTRLGKHLGIDLVGRNLLNPEFERVQENASGTVPIINYKRGAYFGLGLTYKL